ncbi:hypothetical protein pb186bvf_004443 [Paramecium bursaria]
MIEQDLQIQNRQLRAQQLQLYDNFKTCMQVKTVQSKIDLNYLWLSDTRIQYYKENFELNKDQEYRIQTQRTLNLCDEYGSVQQTVTLYIQNKKFIVPNVLISGLHYIWERLVNLFK